MSYVDKYKIKANQIKSIHKDVLYIKFYNYKNYI